MRSKSFDSLRIIKLTSFNFNFSPTLYVGEHQHGLYAMPSLVDKQTLTITPRRSGPLLLEGPKDYDVSLEYTCYKFSNYYYHIDIEEISMQFH